MLIYYEFTIEPLFYLVWKCFVFREYTKKSLFFPVQFLFRQHTIFYACIPWMHYLFREFTLCFTNLLSFSQIYYKFTFYFANLSWIHSLFREFTISSLSFLLIHHEFTLYFANLLWIYDLFFKITFNRISVSWIRYVFRENTMNSLSVLLLHNQFSICYVNKLWINNKLIINKLCVSRIFYVFPCFYANSQWISFRGRKFAVYFAKIT